MSQYDDEHGIDVPCVKCNMPDCVSFKGCSKRQRENRYRRLEEENKRLKEKLKHIQRIIGDHPDGP